LFTLSFFPSYNSADLNFEGSRHHDSMLAYGQSKRANLLFAQGLHSRLAEYNIASLASHPGYSRTNLFANSWHFLPEKLAFVKEWVKNAPSFCSMSSQQGSMMSVRAAVDESVTSGSYVTPMLYATGLPVVSVGGKKSWLWGESWPFVENVWSWVGMGPAFGEDDVDKLFAFSEEKSGLKIQ